MQRKAGNRRREPIRYVVEHVYSGKESMEKVLTAVSEEAAKQNVKEKLENQKKVGFALPVLKADKIPCAAFRGFLPKRVCLNPVCHPVVLLQKMSEGISIPHPVARRMAGCFRSYKIFRSFFRRWSNLA